MVARCAGAGHATAKGTSIFMAAGALGGAREHSESEIAHYCAAEAILAECRFRAKRGAFSLDQNTWRLARAVILLVGHILDLP